MLDTTNSYKGKGIIYGESPYAIMQTADPEIVMVTESSVEGNGNNYLLPDETEDSGYLIPKLSNKPFNLFQ